MTTLLPFPRLRHSDSARAEPGERDQQALADAYGRVATDLRISLTDRCNLRCTYCMPVEGLEWLPRADVLTDEEILRLITIGVERLGIKTVRLTGGEPLLRKNLELLVADIAALTPLPEIALTTNGIGLAARAEKLAAAGLRRINISLDTLDPGTFAELVGRCRSSCLAGRQPSMTARGPSGAAGPTPQSRPAPRRRSDGLSPRSCAVHLGYGCGLCGPVSPSIRGGRHILRGAGGPAGHCRRLA